MKNFPNGFESWAETHHEIVVAIEEMRESEYPPEKIEKIQEEQGTGGFYEFCIELTDKFEELHKGRAWDGEFWDELDYFITQNTQDQERENSIIQTLKNELFKL